MHNHRRSLVTTALLLTLSAALRAQHPAMPAGMTHEQHLADMKKDAELKERGAAAMGFDQNKVAHHFLLDPRGGRIEVSVLDAADEESRNQIRAHLREIAGDFSNGNFDKPFATHNEVPPGVRTMKARRTAITFDYEDIPGGGRVRIASRDPKASAAVRTFLRYQIREHKTGDPAAVK